MSEHPRVRADPALALLDVYDAALPQVYGYLLSRCRDATLAQDLTETFLAAVGSARRGDRPVGSGWLIGVARHKLADHWRRQERETPAWSTRYCNRKEPP